MRVKGEAIFDMAVATLFAAAIARCGVVALEATAAPPPLLPTTVTLAACGFLFALTLMRMCCAPSGARPGRAAPPPAERSRSAGDMVVNWLAARLFPQSEVARSGVLQGQRF